MPPVNQLAAVIKNQVVYFLFLLNISSVKGLLCMFLLGQSGFDWLIDTAGHKNKYLQR